MSETILVVDDKGRVATRVKEALGDVPLAVNAVADVRTAKQILIQADVSLIIIDVALGADPTAGFTLCKQLREHERFSGIPVILLSESVGQDIVQMASACGAQGLVGWPFPLEALKQRLLALIPSIQRAAAVARPAAAPIQPPTPQPVAAKPVAPKPAPAAAAQVVHPAVDTSEPVSVEDKLKKAQHLLALVLHNLKTSNLLEVVEIEDVPGIVLQMARNVCGDSSSTPAKSAPAPTNDSNADLSLNLDSAFGFGIKK